MSELIETDVAIIGAGPVGLFAVFQAGMLGLKSVVVDSLAEVGGQCTALYPEKPIFDIPGHPRIGAEELIQQLEAQAAPFAPTFCLDQQVLSVEPRSDRPGWLLGTAKGTRIAARAVILAAGAGAFGPNRPPLDRLAEFEGRGVLYLVRRREDFRGKRVVIGGGGDSAIDWAISLAEVAAKVSVVHRRAKFRAAPGTVAQLEALAAAGTIDLVVPYQLSGLEGADGVLDGVRVATLDGQEKVIPADVLLPFYGLAMTLGPIADWGLALDRSHIQVDPATMATNRDGFFAVGDIAHYPGKLKLILSGFAEAAMAAHAIYPLVHPDKALHFEYSTTKGPPGSA
ncbi:NAD(P)/FAD-dependent oxidoreductase [Zavarzinia sp. CC-PAN008]|uniref:NAD(P)/FAD-dependent oxidoreductase n=1 Tax=Zavarzinia sp. CC-PAN008 TaxID=3243332 RepID=UPI003F748BC3